MLVHGTCHCGAIALEAEVDPAEVVLCHCTDCQAMSGGGFRVSVPAPAEGFRLLRGRPRLYRKRADSGRLRDQAFCGDCGTALWSAGPDPAEGGYRLRAGCLAERERLPPRQRYWTASAPDWMEELAAIPGEPRD